MKKSQVNRIIGEIGQKIADKSTCRCKVACILVDKKGKVVATGFNHHTENCRLGGWTNHAEMKALNQVRKPSNNLVAIIYRDECKPIHPCPACQDMLEAYEISEIWHSTGEGLNKLESLDYEYDELGISDED